MVIRYLKGRRSLLNPTFVLLICLLTTPIFSYAQFASDALKYSNVYYGGTARFMGLGGAMGAVGADLSTFSTNPAGIGLYRRSEFVFSTSLYSAYDKSEYFNQEGIDTKTAVNIENVGGVFVFDGDKGTSIKKAQFGISLNRLNNFNNKSFVQGYNDRSSFVWGAVDNINSQLGTDFTFTQVEDLLWQSYVITRDFNTEGDPISDFYNDISSAYFDKGGRLLQTQSTYSNGGVQELTFTGGVNVNDRVYVGLTVGVPFLNYSQDTYYSESDSNNKNEYFNSFTLRQKFSSNGAGVNAKLGVIVRAADFVRVGASFHSPTWYPRINESYSSSIESHFRLPVDGDGNKNFFVESPYGYYNWELRTPWKVSASTAFIIRRAGLVSIDYEYNTYSSMSMSPRADFSSENNVIKNSYGSQHIVRVGTEWNVGPTQFRAGYGYYGSPYKNNINDGTRMNISGGLGFKSKYFFVDLSYMYTFYGMDNYLYGSSVDWLTGNPVPAEFAKMKYNNHIITLSLGFKI